MEILSKTKILRLIQRKKRGSDKFRNVKKCACGVSSPGFLRSHQDMRIVDLYPVSELFDRPVQPLVKSAPVRFRGHDVVAVCPAEGDVLVRRVDLTGVKLLPPPIRIPVFQSIFVAE